MAKVKMELDVLPKYKTSDNSRLFNPSYEVIHPESDTVPDQSMTVSQLMKRYASGLPMSGVKVPIYNGEDAILAGIDIAKLDLAEREEIEKEIIARYQESLKNVREMQRKEALDKMNKQIAQQVELQLIEQRKAFNSGENVKKQ